MLLSKQNKFFSKFLIKHDALGGQKTSEGIIFSKPSDFLSSRGYQVEGNKLNRPLERGEGHETQS